MNCGISQTADRLTLQRSQWLSVSLCIVSLLCHWCDIFTLILAF